ncbi:MAG: hypothetical protein FWC71_00330 [Defluviitaleaceae bacterium]|nr:hypothetical protein [Defluviitaleaceae bacterium]
MSVTAIVFVIVFVSTAMVVLFITRVRAKAALRTRLLDMPGKLPELGVGGNPVSLENLDSIARYATHEAAHAPDAWRLDATTWNDLDMDKVFGRVNVCLSSVGEEYLYNCLHDLQQRPNALLEREKLVQFFSAETEERLAVHMALHRLGKENYNGLARLMFAFDGKFLKFQWLYKVLAWMPLLTAALIFVHVPLGVMGLLAAFLINAVVHNRVKDRLEDDIPALEYMNALFACCKRLAARKIDLPVFEKLRTAFTFFKPMMNRLPQSRNRGSVYLDFDFIYEYVRIIFLYDVRNYNRLSQEIKEHNWQLHELFKGVGEIEVALCVQSLRMNLPVACVPEFGNDAQITFEELVHPLIKQPITNTGQIGGDSLLTGSNASGKSTFVKSLALGGVLAQTLHTCAAARFTLRFSWVMTSMVMRDDLSGGDSYFIVEIKSLKRMLERVALYPCTCFIDEILRGTNTVERIAASASVLRWLDGGGQRNCLTVAATHDIELTHLLANTYSNYHFRETVTPAGVTFNYKLQDGPSTTRNAIKLLEVMDFDPQIVTQAQDMAQGYDTTQKWK